MFALEIHFKDGASAPETVFVRRPEAIIGGFESAHVVIDDMSKLDYQLRVVRDVGRRFRCQPLSVADNATISDAGDGFYEGQFEFDTGPVALKITALDCDLLLKESEPPDRAGVRVLRQGCASRGPVFPAVVVRADHPFALSFAPDQPVYIGRAKHCALRLDSPRVSTVHARLGFEAGQFWVEDLGSTNGTFLNGQAIASRVAVAPGEPVIIAREITVLGVITEDQLQRASTRGSYEALQVLSEAEHQYPVLVSLSEVARPSRIVLTPGTTVTIGRDPSSDMWLGAPHVSRMHCAVEVTKSGKLLVADHSTNGTSYDDGMLHRGETLELEGDAKVLNFGGGVTVALCFNKEHEEKFEESEGAPETFFPNVSATGKDFTTVGVVASFPKVAGVPSRLSEERPGKIPFGTRLRSLYHSLGGANRVLFGFTVLALVVAAAVVGTLVIGLFM